MTPELKPNRDEINALRLKAFATNSHDDRMAYYKACSGWFQDEDYRVLARAERDDALIRAALEAVKSLCGDYYRALSSIEDFNEMLAINKQMQFLEERIDALANDPEALAAIRKAAEGRG